MKPAPIALLLAAAVAGAAAGFLAYRQHAASAPGVTPAPTAPVPASAASPAPAPPASADSAAAAPSIPDTVPDISLPDLTGKPHALRSSDGHARLYNFWATWCEPCRREIPLLNTLQGAYAREGLQVVGIAVDFRDAVHKYLETATLRYTLLVGEEDGYEAAQKFGMDLLLPFSVFADGRNRIVAVKVGELHRDEADAILGQMRLLEAGKTDLPAAQATIAATMKELASRRAQQSASK
ncbi:MAG TPA: TlpA disulfide reductase family protein [Steroidobacteraceae bacterium]|nr:TlpA disulfide reductase family protein [Steroidobacteraceae bacterium]